MERVGRGHLRREEPDVVDLGLGSGLHRANRLALGERPVDHPDVRDHAAVLVELGVEDQRPRRRVGVSARRRHAGDQLVEHVGYALAGLGADPSDAVSGLAEELRDLLGHALGLGTGEVDLVQAGDQLEPRVDRQVGVRDRLRLDPLARVDHEQRTLARRERPRHLVGEVDMAGRVDQVQLIRLTIAGFVKHPHRLRLDRDPALALELHRVEHLGAHRSRVDGVGQLEDAVGQRRLAVVDVGDDREVADVSLVGHVFRGYYGAAGGALLPGVQTRVRTAVGAAPADRRRAAADLVHEALERLGHSPSSLARRGRPRRSRAARRRSQPRRSTCDPACPSSRRAGRATARTRRASARPRSRRSMR